MSGAERRENIIQIILGSSSPVPAKRLADEFDVSRQVIVQDIALIRAEGFDILATNRGYMLFEDASEKSRVYKVSHSDEEMEDELCSIIDLGARVENTMVNHSVYGHIEAPLKISSRRDISNFLNRLAHSKSAPLKNTTSGYHYHKICANDESTLDEVEKVLREKGYLVEGKDTN